jgi:SAM-dependent methyltransferase
LILPFCINLFPLSSRIFWVGTVGFEKHFGNDGGRQIEWGRTSDDYAKYRPNYPAEFYARLKECGIGLRGQRILDLGTGVGFLAQEFAAQEATVVGIDIDVGQIEVARERARQANVEVEYHVAPAEQTGLAAGSFDVITASQCWLYFDQKQACAEVIRLLRPGGRLTTCHLCWLPLVDETTRLTEELVRKYSPQWTGGGFDGHVPREQPWMKPSFEVVDFFVFDAAIPFTHDSWRGRFRACRGIGAALEPEAVTAFDQELAKLLEEITPPNFTVVHRIDCHILLPRSDCVTPGS